MSIHFASNTEIDSWDNLIATNPDGGNVLQGKEFMEQKAEAGWTIRYVMIDERAVAIMEK